MNHTNRTATSATTAAENCDQFVAATIAAASCRPPANCANAWDTHWSTSEHAYVLPKVNMNHYFLLLKNPVSKLWSLNFSGDPLMWSIIHNSFATKVVHFWSHKYSHKFNIKSVPLNFIFYKRSNNIFIFLLIKRRDKIFK